MQEHQCLPGVIDSQPSIMSQFAVKSPPNHPRNSWGSRDHISLLNYSLNWPLPKVVGIRPSSLFGASGIEKTSSLDMWLYQPKAMAKVPPMRWEGGQQGFDLQQAVAVAAQPYSWQGFVCGTGVRPYPRNAQKPSSLASLQTAQGKPRFHLDSFSCLASSFTVPLWELTWPQSTSWALRT